MKKVHLTKALKISKIVWAIVCLTLIFTLSDEIIFILWFLIGFLICLFQNKFQKLKRGTVIHIFITLLFYICEINASNSIIVDKELAIEFIGGQPWDYYNLPSEDFKDSTILSSIRESLNDYYNLPREDGEAPCYSFQHYTIANYKQIPSDSLASVLNKYIHSRYPYDKHVENIIRNSMCRFFAYFYEKSLFVDYRKYMFDAIYYSENGSIDEYRYKLVAQIYGMHFVSDKVSTATILYDVDKCSIFYRILEPISNEYFYQNCISNIKWEKENTIKVQADHD